MRRRGGGGGRGGGRNRKMFKGEEQNWIKKNVLWKSEEVEVINI